jgi:hypothetical protein
MINLSVLAEIDPAGTPSTVTAAHVASGLPIPKPIRVRNFSPDDWEEFTQEYGHSLKSEYATVKSFKGAGDMGVDIAAFVTDGGFSGGWDSFQCKRYDHALRPSDIWVELGKIIYYSFKGEYPKPRKHFFCASQDIGTSLQRLLADSSKLKQQCREAWPRKCENDITSTQAVPLDGDLLAYFDGFDFAIFTSKTTLELIEGHEKTQFHAVRFGGGLPPRPALGPLPDQPQQHESRYIRQLLDAYSDHAGADFTDLVALSSNEKMSDNFRRQRERFYNAEALRNFARDTVPEGTFANLQDEIYHAVADIQDASHANGFDRMVAVTSQAALVTSTSNPLQPATNTQDRQGICHQLANDDRLQWVNKNG